MYTNIHSKSMLYISNERVSSADNNRERIQGCTGRKIQSIMVTDDAGRIAAVRITVRKS